MKEQLKSLWKTCFHDSDEFIELYFRRRYTPENTLVSQDGDRITASLQMLPYPMTFHGQTISTSYISGACTHPDYRNKGIMRGLLTQALGSMFQKQVDVATLIPAEDWLYNYYGTFGFAAVFAYHPQSFLLTGRVSTDEITVSEQTGFSLESYRYLDEALRKRPCCVQHTEEDIRTVWEDLKLDKGCQLTARSRSTGQITGTAFVSPGEEGIYIHEICAENSASHDSLLQEAVKKYRRQRLLRKAPVSQAWQERKRSGMLRIVHARQLLQAYAQASNDLDIRFSLHDPLFPANNGHYHLHHGTCSFVPGTTNPASPCWEVQDLSEWLFADVLPPYMSLMMD